MTMTDMTAAAQSRRRAKRGGREGWSRLVAGYRVSDLTVQQYCDREGVSTASFYRWRSLLSTGDEPGLASDPVGEEPAQRAGFVDLGTVTTLECPVQGREARARAEPARRFDVRLDLGDGLVLTLSRA